MRKYLKTILIIITFFMIFILIYYYNIKHNDRIIEEINIKKKHYNESVITTKETKLYIKNENEYNEFGNINEGIILTLSPITIDSNTQYFEISGINLYIKYDDVIPHEKKYNSKRYLNYIPFNENIKTKEITNFYDVNDNYLFTINKSFDFMIYIKEDNKYGVVFNDELIYIHSSDIDSIYSSVNTNLKNKNGIKTLTYHAIYNPETAECNTSICQPLSMFESHLKYIRENDYFTLKLDELELYLDGKLQIPEKSIVITIDDGTLFDLGAIELLEKYEVNATLFVITSWVDISHFKSKYLDLESHTHNMHNQYECPGYGLQGGGILCLSEDYILEDLKMSQEILGGSRYLAYPFFDFNDRAINLLKQAGFKMAFIGEWDSEGYSYPNKTDKYKVRRKTIFSDISMNEFISYLQ